MGKLIDQSGGSIWKFNSQVHFYEKKENLKIIHRKMLGWLILHWDWLLFLLCIDLEILFQIQSLLKINTIWWTISSFKMTTKMFVDLWELSPSRLQAFWLA